MKKIIPILFFFTLFQISAFSQGSPFGGFGGGGKVLKGKITGVLVDSLSNAPIGYATLVLKKAGLSSEKDGILTGDDGKFKFGETKLI